MDQYREVVEAEPVTELAVHVTEDAATAAIIFETRLGRFVSIGSAKRHPKDMPDTEVGAALAISRALAGLANQFHAYAWERVQ